MKKNAKATIIVLSLIVFIVCIYIDIFCGNININIQDFLRLLNGKDTFATEILAIIRIPKVIKAIIAGSCLAVSGMFLQTITKNPLVEPYLTGVSSGAGLAFVTCIALNVNTSYISLFATLGALLVSLLVIFLAGINKFSLIKLILFGLSINIFASSLISAIILFNPQKTHSMMTILTGNTGGSFVNLKLILILFTCTILISFLMVPRLNFMILDDTIIKAINSNVGLYFIIIIILSSVLASLSVASAGILGFIGIIIPHLSRILIGQDFKWLFILNILLGSSIILISDFISRWAIYPSEIPLGVVVSIIGAPIFVGFLIFRGDKLYA